MDGILQYFLNVEVMRAAWPLLWSGFFVTLRIAVLTVILGIPLGLLVACLKAYRVPLVDQFLTFYIDLFRAVPSLVVLVIVYFGLPYAGLSFSGEVSAILGLGVVLSAYAAEIFWAGIRVVPKGQWEAGFATGLSFTQALVYIVLPRAVALGIPVLTNRTIAVIKGTAYGAMISAQEILSVSSSAQQTFANPTPLVVGACLYLIIFFPLVIASRAIEARYAVVH